MSDDRLRELERTFATTGAHADEVTLLRERLRAGTLDRERVKLAAFLGHPPAREILTAAELEEVDCVEDAETVLHARNVVAPPYTNPLDWALAVGLEPQTPRPTGVHPQTLEEWVFGVRRWGDEAGVRVAVASARLALPAWVAANPRDTRPESAIASAEAWLACPCEDHRRATQQAQEDAWGATALPEMAPDIAAACAAAEAARATTDTHYTPTHGRDGMDHVATAARAAASFAAESGQPPAQVAAAIRRALVPWALGVGKPLSR